MSEFSQRSKDNLAEAHQDLQTLFNEVIKHFDCTVICGHRGQIEQDDAHDRGFSQLKYPNSKHNSMPSSAVDVVPYFKEKPHIRWEDDETFRNFGWYVLGIAKMLKQYGAIENNITWGGQWKSFRDYPHYEI